MRRLLRREIQELDDGRPEAVRETLAKEEWLRDLDLTGVPDEVIRETRTILAEAREALAGEADPDTARDAVQRALVIW